MMNATRKVRMRTRQCKSIGPFAVLSTVALMFLSISAPAEEGFSGSNAYAILRVLSEEIGPRPMGSPAEQRALAYAASTLAAYGCDTSYIMPMRSPHGTNTMSGVAVGVLRGATGRIIVIGGHLDSSGPEIPGANDDGSGTACVLELARVLGPRQLQSTIVFACFGGEEEGLLGSEHFVAHFPHIDSVMLMLQIDMADGSSYLELDPDAPDQVSAPQWLPEAAMEEYYSTLGFENLRYHTNMSTLNASTPGGTGSDHISFLTKGIPALDLTSDVGFPIHTSLDNFARFDSSGLARSGNLVLRLVERFDGGVPSRTTEQYYLVQFGKHLVFITHPVLLLFAGLAFGLSVVVFMVLRRRRLRDRTLEPRWSLPKLALFAMIVQAFVWLPETVVGLIKGMRHPWVNGFEWYVALAFLTALVGIWIVVRLATKWRLQSDPFPYYVPFFILVVGGLFGAFMLNPEIALYAAWPLFWVSVAMLLRPAWMKAALFLLGAYLPLRLIFLESSTFVQRALSSSAYVSPVRDGIVDLLYIGGFMFFSLPFVYAFAALYRSSTHDLFFLKRFRGPRMLLLPAAGALILGGYVLTLPDYGGSWHKKARVEQRYVTGEDSSTVRVTGSEGVDDVIVTIAGEGSVPAGGTGTYEKSFVPPSPGEWLRYDETTAVRPDSLRPDSLVRIDRVIDLDSPVRPLSIDIRYHSEQPIAATSPWSIGGRRRLAGGSDRSAVLSWYAFPEMPLRIPVRLTVRRGQSVTESVEATYDTLAAPITFAAPATLFRHRMTIARNDTLRVPGGE